MTLQDAPPAGAPMASRMRPLAGAPMTMISDSAVTALLTVPTAAPLRPHHEGSNICTWIGFKHVSYLVEAAVREHFRRAELPVGWLYEECGLGLDLVELDTRIHRALHLDDAVVAEVVPGTGPAGDELSFQVRLARAGARWTDVTAAVRAILRRDRYIDPHGAVPEQLARFTADRVGGYLPARPVTDRDSVSSLLLADQNGYGWWRRIPYPYCHFNERMAMSGYLRQLEETVDRFLADRGISIRQLLDDRRWIPVVPHSRIRILDEAMMEEELYTAFVVTECFKDFTYTARMDTYVQREGRLVQTSTGAITHGYAVVQDRRDWRLVPFDPPVREALARGGTRT